MYYFVLYYLSIRKFDPVYRVYKKGFDGTLLGHNRLQQYIGVVLVRIFYLCA